ncbi:DUF4126 domain-containing protein [Flavimarina sp. Hel_I_48]|uniref:DUF4126 domain-containing protein n=1 Tax=Flavimarina sp. Hel_I_48 TaxID=1392488 RepID=UPI0004DEE4DF|nr:DUF4126 domain-containing protein [Flavimarina sp. Hel_I_48]
MEVNWLISAALGIGLATAVGFRVFLPLLVLSLAARFDIVPIADSWQWVGSLPALILLTTASFIEILGYYIPWVDNLLDTLAVPLAGIAGTLVLLATLVDVDPYISWALAIIAGGGTAVLFAGSTATVRAASTATTAGLGNAAVSTAETGVATGVSVLAIFAPVIAIILCIIAFYIVFKLARKIKRKKQNKSIKRTL